MKQRYAFSLLFAAGALVALSFSRPMANRTYIQFKGTKQGLFKGASKGAGGKEDQGWFEIESFGFGAVNTASSAGGSGGKAGKVSLTQIVVTKKTDAASPLLLKGYNGNESLESVVIETVGRPGTAAGETVVSRITLTNAQIVQYHAKNGEESVILKYDQATNWPSK